MCIPVGAIHTGKSILSPSIVVEVSIRDTSRNTRGRSLNLKKRDHMLTDFYIRNHIYVTFTSHLHHIYITFTSHLRHIYITFTSHLRHIYITFTSHLRHIYVTFTSHLHPRSGASMLASVPQPSVHIQIAFDLDRSQNRSKFVLRKCSTFV